MQFPRVFRPLFGDVLWKVNTSSKVIYLTFDDGPVPDVTPELLNLLDDYGWKATFFCVGENVSKYPEIFEEIKKRGHSVGNHSYNHLKGFECDLNTYVENVEKADELIQSKLFRPPYGRIKREQIDLLKKKYKIVMWDLITHDYSKNYNSEKILKLLKKYLRPGSIVVFHDSYKAKKNLFESIGKAIEFWESRGYKSGTL